VRPPWIPARVECGFEASPRFIKLCLERGQLAAADSRSAFSAELALFQLQFALLKLKVFIRDLHESPPLFLFDVEDIVGKPGDVLDAERGFQ